MPPSQPMLPAKDAGPDPMETLQLAPSSWLSALNNLSIRMRLFGLGAASIVMIAGIGTLSIRGISRITGNLQQVTITGQSLRNHLEADMMHDAIRGDVYAALSGLNTPAEIKESLKAHVERFRETVKSNQALPLSPAIRAELAQSSAKLEAYIVAAEEICAVAATNPRRAREILPHFMNAFTELEKLNDELSDKIEKGALEAEKLASADGESVRSLCIGLVCFAVVLQLILALTSTRALTRPIERMVDALEMVASGHLNHRAETSGGLEISRMATALNQALAQISKTLLLIRDSSNAIHDTSGKIYSRNTEISAAARSTASSAQELDAASNSVAERLSTVSASGLELTASIREIASQSASAARLASEASDAADSASKLFSVLENANQEIGNVIGIISSIADQTNLLALNAAIEAARAGDAGRGFSVVASEVKDLASQTTQATEEISSRIAEIQAQTGRSIQAIRDVTVTISSVTQVSTAIAAAVEEQSAVAQGIEEQLHDASRSTQEIAASVNLLARNATITNDHADNSVGDSRRLNEISTTLEKSVGQFTLAA